MFHFFLTVESSSEHLVKGGQLVLQEAIQHTGDVTTLHHGVHIVQGLVNTAQQWLAGTRFQQHAQRWITGQQKATNERTKRAHQQ